MRNSGMDVGGGLTMLKASSLLRNIGGGLSRCGNCACGNNFDFRFGVCTRFDNALLSWFAPYLLSLPLLDHCLWHLTYSGLPPALATHSFVSKDTAEIL